MRSAETSSPPVAEGAVGAGTLQTDDREGSVGQDMVSGGQAGNDELEQLKQENRELRARLADLETIVTMMPVPIAISGDAESTEIEVNASFAALLGVDTDVNISLVGPEASTLPFKFLRQGKPALPSDLPMHRAAGTRQEVRDELEIVRDDGLRYHIYGSARPLFDENGNVRRTFSAFIDVTERKRAERNLEQSIEAVKKANEELQQFTYAASHDLQEPLRTIGSWAQLLERRYGGDPETAEYTALIIDGVDRMRTLIEDLLKYSRIGAATGGRRVYLDLGNAVQWAMLDLDAKIREQKAAVKHDDLPEVIADESQMAQLFQNLISNALKYKSDLPPLIDISAEELDEDWLISVRDNGIGIDPKYSETIFGVFKRLHGRDVPGTGIGLAICRKIVENHGGKLWVESDGKNGSNFRFTLPK
jgi:PAS domain S-box-containing protein